MNNQEMDLMEKAVKLNHIELSGFIKWIIIIICIIVVVIKLATLMQLIKLSGKLFKNGVR